MTNPADAPADNAPHPETATELNPEQVASYLRAHPDFFLQHPSLIEEVKLPHDAGRAVSLVERQVAILRERNVEARRTMNQLLQAARENDQIFEKTRALTLALLETRSLRELNEVLATHLLVDFNADFVCCHLTGGYQPLDHICVHGEIPFSSLVNGATATCATLRRAELEQIFPSGTHDEAGSAVLIPFDTPGATAILAVGSRDPGHFSPDMDTLFVTYMTQILGKVINHLIQGTSEQSR